MSRPTHHKRRKAVETGSALVEFAVAVPLLIAIVYGTLYLTDLGLFKLKSLEITRYTAWGLATRPLSAYSSGIYPAQQIASNLATRLDVETQYVDLDGAQQWTVAGVSRLTSAGQLMTVTLTNETAPIVPGIGDAGYAGNLSILGQLARVLGIGPNLDGVIASLFDKIGFDGSGYIKAQAPVLVTLPWMGNDGYRALLLAQAGSIVNADLSPWAPVPGFVIADKDNNPIQTAVLADPWRLQQGFGIRPPYSTTTGYQLTVQRMYRNIPRLIPVLGLFLPGFSGSQNIVVASRPYAANRGAHDQGAHGQMGMQELTGAALETGAVNDFETGALYNDAAGSASSPYVIELNARGGSFMGCGQSQKRGCR